MTLSRRDSHEMGDSLLVFYHVHVAMCVGKWDLLLDHDADDG